jgi:hypothetical protein
MGELIVNMFMSLDGVALKLYAVSSCGRTAMPIGLHPATGRMTPRPGLIRTGNSGQPGHD